MKITAVYECRVSGGTDRLLIHLIKSWPDKNDRWQVLCYVKNSGLSLFRQELKGSAEVLIFSHGKIMDDVCESLILRGGVNAVFGFFLKKLLFPVACLNRFIYFWRFFKKSRPDIVFLQKGGYPGAFSEHIAGVAARTLDRKIKVVTSIQNLPDMNKGKVFFRVIDSITNYYTDSFIFASKYTMEIYLKKTKLRKSSMCIINEGVIANAKDVVINNSRKEVSVGMIAAYERRKGHRILFDAIGILKKKGISNFRIHCFGQSRYGEFNKIIQYAKNLGIYKLLDWHEYEPDLDKLYGILDIIVQPSIYGESMPLVPIDAAAYYKPVIASRLQGTIEVVEDAVTGYLFDTGDSNALAGYLEELIKDSKKREDMGKIARNRFTKYFTAERMANEYYDVFMANSLTDNYEVI